MAVLKGSLIPSHITRAPCCYPLGQSWGKIGKTQGERLHADSPYCNWRLQGWILSWETRRVNWKIETHFEYWKAERKYSEPVKKRALWLCNNLSWERAVGVGLMFCGKDDNWTISFILLICSECNPICLRPLLYP